MEYRNIGKIKVSSIAIGGHYTAMEEGLYEERTAYVQREANERAPIIQKAINEGINFFDTTWRNEVETLAATLNGVSFSRESIYINGMVLGSFTGSNHFGMEVSDYFDKWLNERLKAVPGGYFDTFMINAIEEGYDRKKCDILIAHALKRKASGDFRMFGFSSHSPGFARKILDTHPQFELAMVPYNYMRRAFEDAFDDYSGNAAFIAMKPLVWAEYGIPFCALNYLPESSKTPAIKKRDDASALALRFIRENRKISATFCAVNAMQELDLILSAGDGENSEADNAALERYRAALEEEDKIPFFLSGLLVRNLRMNSCGYGNLAQALGVTPESIPLNEPDSGEKILGAARSLAPALKNRGRDDLALVLEAI